MCRHDACACTAIAHAEGLEGKKKYIYILKKKDKIDELSKVDKSGGGLRRS